MILNLPTEEICKKYLAGMNSVELAKEYDCNPDTIVKRLRGNGITIRTNSEVQRKRHSENINSYYIELPIKEICEEYQNGISAGKLAKKYGCSEPIIRQRLRDNNIKIRSYIECQIGLQIGDDSPNYIDLPIDEICEKYINNMNTVELAEEYGCSSTAITKRLCDNNIKIRSTSEAQKLSLTNRIHPLYLDLPIEEICEKYINGMNTLELAEIYGCAPKTIINRLYDNNVKPRSISEMERTSEHRQRLSAALQGITYDEWESFANDQRYCHLFNESFKNKIRNDYNNRCFLCGKTKEENGRNMSIHHTNYNKNCLCGVPCEFVPLCNSCHPKTNSNRRYWEDLIMNYLYPNRYFMVEI